MKPLFIPQVPVAQFLSNDTVAQIVQGLAASGLPMPFTKRLHQKAMTYVDRSRDLIVEQMQKDIAEEFAVYSQSDAFQQALSRALEGHLASLGFVEPYVAEAEQPEKMGTEQY